MMRGLAILGGLVVASVVTVGVVVAPVSAQDPGPREVARTATCTTNATGYCTIPHQLGVAPTWAQATEYITADLTHYDVHFVKGGFTADTFRVRAMHSKTDARKNLPITFFYELRAEAPDVPPTTTTTTTTTTTAPPPPPPPPPPPSGDRAVCGTQLLDGPSTPPDGAMTVPAGDNSNLTFAFRESGKTFWFAPGTHTLGSSEYDQIQPGDNSTFLGAPGAVLDGKGINRYAFTQHAKNVTIKHLTVKGFVPPNDEGVVNHDSGDDWVIEKNTFESNKGAALMAGKRQVMRTNCIRNNGQYSLNAYQAGTGPEDLVLEGNEISGNATEGEPYAGCGCSGGMKFWSVDGADIRNNWIHHNNGVGIWADNNNNDFLIENNLIEDNDDHAMMLEQSYNALVRDNVMKRNAWGIGRDFAARGDSFPIGAIYVSEAGGDSRIPARYTKLEITNNEFVDNWGGIAVWENADRFCNSPNNTGSDCTLPMGGTTARNAECSQPGIASDPLFWDCRWRSKNVEIHHNTFSIDVAKVDGGCQANFCATQSVFSNYGSSPDWSPYKGRVIQDAITFTQNNKWHDNTYTGQWKFIAWEPGNIVPFQEWQGAYSQDSGSTVN